MTSNYLIEKYPNVGYKKHISSPKTLHYLSSEYKENQVEWEEYNKLTIKTLPYTNVCNCGEEWESSLSFYQEGCYPYQTKLCRDCEAIAREEERKEIEEARKQKEEEKKQDQIDYFDHSIPPRYRGKLSTPINKELLTSTCSIVWGGFGTGKTWEAYSVAKELVVNDVIKTWKLITEIDMLNNLKDGFDSMQGKIDYYKYVDLLILDEAGKNNDSDFNKAQLFGILNHRYDWEKKTILICNAKTREEIRALLPTATLDRFRECVVEMNGNSKRYRR